MEPMISINDMAAKIKQYLSMFDDIAFAFLFGSSAQGEATILSDVDIAIYFTGAVDFYRINSLREDLSELLGRETDIVVLNNASPIIRMQVLKNGTLILGLNRRLYNEFFVNTMKEYDDLKRTRKDIEDKILRGRIYA
jgi:predicted nucleotidyltransferase